jgi:hypothetical protein
MPDGLSQGSPYRRITADNFRAELLTIPRNTIALKPITSNRLCGESVRACGTSRPEKSNVDRSRTRAGPGPLFSRTTK